MAKGVKPISLYKLSNGAHYAFHDAVLSRIESDPKIKQKVPVQLERYRKAIQAENEALVLSKKNLLSDEIAEADSMRDTAYTAFKGCVKAFASIANADTQPAGKRLAQLLKDYNINVHDALYKQTGLMINLLEDLEGKYKPDVNTLSLNKLVDFMRAGNDKVRLGMAERNEQDSVKVTGAAAKARDLIDEIYDGIMQSLQAYAIVEATKDYDAFFASITQLVDYYNKRYIKLKGKKRPTNGKTGDTNADDKDKEEKKEGGDAPGEEIPDPIAPPSTPTGGDTPGGDDDLPDPLA
ncbi:MAG: DUF6261 family protein [Mediterranea sp.]|jgi:hypothetical protein|nr:DUF6261 family protein [Mediterranea sp.]